MATEYALFAGGCFWGMQELYRHLPGVIKTRVGYTGGDVANATYKHHGTHAEALQIEFDNNATDYRSLLLYFFKIHNPTTLNRQGNDKGTSYRSEIFYFNEQQKAIAFAAIQEIEASGKWPGQIVTQVSQATTFWEAEPEHQDYLQHYPGGYTCHFPRDEWTL